MFWATGIGRFARGCSDCSRAAYSIRLKGIVRTPQMAPPQQRALSFAVVFVADRDISPIRYWIVSGVSKAATYMPPPW